MSSLDAAAGWAADLVLVFGFWLLGRPDRRGFLCLAAGDVAWAALGAYRGSWDLAAVCVVFTLQAGLAYRHWPGKGSHVATVPPAPADAPRAPRGPQAQPGL